MRMRPFGRLLPAETALSRLLRAARPVAGTERIPLEAAVGRVAARRATAARPVPAFARATWDGYAVRSRDVAGATSAAPIRLPVVGAVYAEGNAPTRLRPGTAVAIATGGAMPPGADAVAIVEHVRESPGAIALDRPVPAGERIAAPGSDLRRGAVLVRPGDLLTPARLGALAIAGHSGVTVHRRPTVAIVPNGNELVPPGGPLGAGQIHEANTSMLVAVVEAAGGIPSAVPPVRDDPDAIERALRVALRSSDLVVVTGGSSVGDHDYLPTVFPRIGRLLFHGIAVRPGKPTLAAAAHGRLLVGMPGHPTSCLSNAYWLLLPVLRRLAHRTGPGWTEGLAVLEVPVDPAPPPFVTIVPLAVRDGKATPTFRDSSAVTSLTGANAYAYLPAGTPPLRAGAPVRVRRLPAPLAAADA